MLTTAVPTAPSLRTLLLLGRVSNLPTVWSNCLAGWLLAGGGSWPRFLTLSAGATMLYVGGMYLNDAFDADFDRQHRPERPVPSGAISVTAVWRWGLGWLVLGLVCLSTLGKTTALLAALLSLSILIYDAVHKIFAFSPLLMAVCRLFLVLAAASAGRVGITGLSIWSGLALASYVAGLSYLARKESLQTALKYWPCLFLAAPVVLSVVVNRGDWLFRGVLFSGILILWMLNCLRYAYWSEHRNVGHSVAGLLAGIVLVDWLAVGSTDLVLGAVFLGLFGLALLFQRFIPAT